MKEIIILPWCSQYQNIKSKKSKIDNYMRLLCAANFNRIMCGSLHAANFNVEINENWPD